MTSIIKKKSLGFVPFKRERTFPPNKQQDTYIIPSVHKDSQTERCQQFFQGAVPLLKEVSARAHSFITCIYMHHLVLEFPLITVLTVGSSKLQSGNNVPASTASSAAVPSSFFSWLAPASSPSAKDLRPCYAQCLVQWMTYLA